MKGVFFVSLAALAIPGLCWKEENRFQDGDQEHIIIDTQPENSNV